MNSPCRFTAVLVAAITATGLSLERAHPQAPGRKAANAGQAIRKSTELRGEWRRAGASFACVVKAPERLQPGSAMLDTLARACSFLGPFALGDNAGSVIKALGAPHRTLAQPGGATASFYFLEQPEHHPYLVVTAAKDRIIALQVTGPVAAKGYSFNHIDLGSSTDTLVQYFGSPDHLEPSSEKNTDVWTYHPWPFSFEVKDNRVTSIRIAEPI